LVVVVLLLPGLGIGKHKEEKIDPRLKQIHTVFLKGDSTAVQDIQAKQAEIEKDSCLRLVPDADTADAVLKVNYSPGGFARSLSYENRGQAIQDVNPYHTSMELSIREGTKLKKIWARDLDLDERQEQARRGTLRLMDVLRQDACGGR
jgi:hypothetical protein